ncbi:MAG: Sec-independent protein translocase protein TatA/E [Pseudomonadota bacterium]|jgi:sec-independent protein translocase protein TatA
MLGLSPIHLILVLIVVVVLFGKGRISGLMGDVAQGVKAFKKGLSDEDAEAAKPVQIDAQAAPVAEAEKQADKTV